MKSKNESLQRILIAVSIAMIIIALIFTMVFALRREDNGKNIYESSIVDDSFSTQESFDSSAESLETSDATSVFDEVTDDSESGEELPIETFHGWIINDYGYTYIYDNCGYEQFNYKTTALNRYVNSINKLAEVLPKDIRMFSIIVPVSSTFVSIPKEIYVADNFYNQSQSAFVSTVNSKLNERIYTVPVVELLEAEYDKGESVFFKTDKNWTSLGAYHAYSTFCQSASLNAYSLESFKKENIGPFLGSFYTATELEDMFEHPDDFIVYSTLPTVKTALSVIDNGLVYSNYSLCENPVSLTTGYSCYLGRTAEKYELSSNADGGALLVIGDSSAYPMIPFLASHYSKIDIIDPVKCNDQLESILKTKDYDDCIMICYSTNAVSGEFIPEFNKFLGGIDG